MCVCVCVCVCVYIVYIIHIYIYIYIYIYMGASSYEISRLASASRSTVRVTLNPNRLSSHAGGLSSQPGIGVDEVTNHYVHFYVYIYRQTIYIYI